MPKWLNPVKDAVGSTSFNLAIGFISSLAQLLCYHSLYPAVLACLHLASWPIGGSECCFEQYTYAYVPNILLLQHINCPSLGPHLLLNTLRICGFRPFATASYDASHNATRSSSCSDCRLLPSRTAGLHLPQLLLPLLQQLLLLLLCCLPGLSPLLVLLLLALRTKIC